MNVIGIRYGLIGRLFIVFFREKVEFCGLYGNFCLDNISYFFNVYCVFRIVVRDCELSL